MLIQTRQTSYFKFQYQETACLLQPIAMPKIGLQGMSMGVTKIGDNGYSFIVRDLYSIHSHQSVQISSLINMVRMWQVHHSEAELLSMTYIRNNFSYINLFSKPGFEFAFLLGINPLAFVTPTQYIKSVTTENIDKAYTLLNK